MLIRIDQIVVPARLRQVSKAKLPPIVASIKESGQLVPIIVWKSPIDSSYRLVDGLHRLAALKQLGSSSIEADEKTFLHGWSQDRVDLELRKIEVDANLSRSNLSATDQTIFINEKIMITLGIQVVEEKEAAEKASEEANRGARAARAALKNSENEVAAATATRVLQAALSAQVNSTQKCKRAQERVDEVLAPQDKTRASPKHIKGVMDVRQQVGEELGMAGVSMERFHKWSRNLSRELLEAISGSRLDSTQQLDSLVSLKNRAEEYVAKKPRDDQESKVRASYTPKYTQLYADVVATATKGKFIDVHAEYSELTSNEGKEVADIRRVVSMMQEDTQWKTSWEKLRDAAHALEEVAFLANSSYSNQSIKAKKDRLEQAARIVSELRSWAYNGMESARPQKVYGNERKYKPATHGN